MDDKILTSINKYYELKKEYNLKNKKNLEKKCIKCNKDGGTIFTSKKGILKAICGNKYDKCNLNIEIYRGDHKNIEILYNEYNDNLTKLKNSIIKLKLNYIVKYDTEEQITDAFNKYKKQMNITEKAIKKIYNNNNDVLNNSKNQYKLNVFNNNLNDEINELNKLKQNYIESKNFEYIRMIINKYSDTIIPLLKTIMNLKYSDVNIGHNKDDEYCLNQSIYNIGNFEYINRNPKIINFKI